MAGTNVLRFDPQKIMEASVKLEQQHKRFVQCTASIKKKAESLSGSWKSDSSSLYLEKIKELDTQSAEAAKALLAFSQNLASTSGIYKAGEAGAKKKAESLPTDGVFRV